MARSGLLAALPKFRRGAFGIFLLTVALSAIVADQPVAQHLLLTPGGVLQGEDVWQPLTANFIMPDGAVGFVFGTLIVQWFVGSELEGFWGIKKYLALVIGCSTAGYLMSALLAPLSAEIATVQVGGSTAMDLAALTAFAVVFGKRPLRLLGALPLSARGLAILVGVVTVISPLARGAPWPTVIPWVVAIVGALLLTTQPWRRLRDSGKVGGSKRRKRGHLKVVRPNGKLLN